MGRMIKGSLRTWVRDIHLYAALVFGALFVMSGLTGVLLAWNHELDASLNPALLQSRVPSGSAEGTSVIGSERVEQVVKLLAATPGYGKPTSLMLPDDEHDVFVAWYRPAVRGKTLFGTDLQRQVMLDQYSLEILGERNYGEFGVSRPLLMPTLFHLHRYLLAGEGGKWVIGVSGFVLFLTSLLGFALWWPQMKWSSLKMSLTVRGRLTSRQFNYSFHRAAGFFVSPVLALLGFSGMAMNLPDVVRPVVGAVATLEAKDKLANSAAEGRKLISITAAMEAAKRAVPEGRISRVNIGTGKAPYELRMRQEGEVRKGDGNTRISIDSFSGEILRLRNPLNTTSGETFFNWLFPLHSGEAFGVPGRALISFAGLMPLIFMITGLVLWLGRRAMKRQARQVAAPAAPAAAPAPQPQPVAKVG
jgi:uncharacterized iron-regulated membrane protein